MTDVPETTSESGFTLIELLVVIAIIGILAAIALPVFLSQREKAQDSAVKSDLRDLAQFEEGYLVGSGLYGSFADLAAAGEQIRVTQQVTVNLSYTGSTGYCLTGKHAASSNTWYYDSLSGGLQAKGSAGCPVSIGGVDGGSLTG